MKLEFTFLELKVDYPGLVFKKASKVARETSTPALVHVDEVTQPQGHSTSGSHERYKSKEYLQWEKEHDCVLKFKEWIVDQGISSPEELEILHKKVKKEVREEQKEAFKEFSTEMNDEISEVTNLIKTIIQNSSNSAFVQKELDQFLKIGDATRKDIIAVTRKVLRIVRQENNKSITDLKIGIKYKKT